MSELTSVDRVGYIWISDIHVNSTNVTTMDREKRSARAITDIANRADIDFVCVGGDLLNGTSNLTVACKLINDWLEPLKDCKKPIIFLMGNHDDNAYGSSAFPKSTALWLLPRRSEFYNNIQFGDSENGYFYFDIHKKHTRVVCLNSCDYPSNKSAKSWWSLSEQQVKWFATQAVNTSYNIIILSHMCPDKKYNFWNLGDEGGYHTDLINIISTYNNRGSISLYNTVYNYETAQGKITFIHAGHTHLEPVETPIVGGIPCVITSCAKAWEQAPPSYFEAVEGMDNVYRIPDDKLAESHFNSNNYIFYHWADRTLDTINEALFDVVSATPSVINTIRIGSGLDRQFNL